MIIQTNSSVLGMREERGERGERERALVRACLAAVSTSTELSLHG